MQSSKNDWMVRTDLSPSRQKLVLIAALTVGSAAAATCFAWLAHYRPLLQILPTSDPTQFNAGVCFLLLASALLCAFNLKNILTAQLLAMMCFFIAVLTFIECISGWNLGIDTLLVEPFLVVSDAPKGQMSPNTALAFILSSAALVLKLQPCSAIRIVIASALVSLACTISLLSLSGYGLDIKAVYGWAEVSRMPLSSALSHLLIASTLVVLLNDELQAFQRIYGVWYVGVAAALGLFFSFCLWRGALTTERNAITTILNYDTSLLANLIQHRVDSNIQLLKSVERFFASSDLVSEREFQSFTHEFIKSDPSIIAVDWAPRIEEKDRIAFEKKQGIPTLLQLDSLNQLRPRDRAEAYYPVRLSSQQPFASSPIGFDHFSDSRRASKMLKAIKERNETSTEPLRLFRLRNLEQTPNDFLIFVPVLEGSGSPPVGDSPLIKGFVVGVFRLSQLVNSVLDPSLHKDIGITFHVESSQGSVQGVVRQVEHVDPHSSLTAIQTPTKTVSIAGVDWNLTFIPNSVYIARHSTSFPLTVLIASLIITIGFSAYLLIMRKQRLLLSRAFNDSVKFRKEMEVARDAAEAATTAKSQFLANMSHEIRTPLTAILGFTETMLVEDLSAEERRMALTTVFNNGEHLLRLINDILDLSKIEAGKLEIEPLSISLSSLISDVSNIMQPRAAEKGLSYGFEYAYPLPQRFVSDPLRLKQILINLIGNAIKFTLTGGIKVRVSFNPKNQKLSFSVIDTGIGLSEEQQGRLFKAFSQADSSTTRKFGGSGLGLMVSAQLAERLGGSVTVESSPGRGSAFTVTVSTGSVDEKDLTHEIHIHRHSIHFSPEASEKLSGHVLVAEDGVDNQKYLTNLLRKLNLEVTLVENGQMAVEKNRLMKFDLILMDMQMPVMDGYTAVRILREEGCETPIVALTANAMKSDMDRCKEAGCSDFLGKPFRRDDFFRKVRETLSRSSKFQSKESSSRINESSDPLLDDPEFMELVRAFRANLPQRLLGLEEALAGGDLEKIAGIAHQLRGAGGYYGCPTLSEVCGTIEDASRVQNRVRVRELFITLRKVVADTLAKPAGVSH